MLVSNMPKSTCFFNNLGKSYYEHGVYSKLQGLVHEQPRSQSQNTGVESQNKMSEITLGNGKKLDWVDVHTIEYTAIELCCTPGIYIMFLTNVTSVNLTFLK